MVRCELIAGTAYPIQAVPFWREANDSICCCKLPAAATVSSLAFLICGISPASVFSETCAEHVTAIDAMTIMSLVFTTASQIGNKWNIHSQSAVLTLLRRTALLTCSANPLSSHSLRDCP